MMKIYWRKKIMIKTTQKHLNIIDELRERALRDLSLLYTALLPDEKERFNVAIQGLETTKKRMQIDLLQQEKERVEDALLQLNG